VSGGGGMSCCCEEGPFGAIIAPLKALSGATDESLGVKLKQKDYTIEKAKKQKVSSSFLPLPFFSFIGPLKI